MNLIMKRDKSYGLFVADMKQWKIFTPKLSDYLWKKSGAALPVMTFEKLKLNPGG